MRSLIFLIVLLLSLPAVAKEKLVVATCGDRGCTCALSSVTADEAAIVLGLNPPPEGPGEVKLVEYDGAMMWTRLSLRDLNILAGGDDECPLQLFPTDEIIPRDGTWVGKAKPISVIGCPPGIGSMLGSMVDRMAFPRRIAWNGRFHPDKMSDRTSEAAIRWTQVSPRSYRGTLSRPPALSEQAKISIDFHATLVSPETVRGLVRLRVETQGGPGSGRVLEAAGLSKCRIVTRFDFRRQGL